MSRIPKYFVKCNSSNHKNETCFVPSVGRFLHFSRLEFESARDILERNHIWAPSVAHVRNKHRDRMLQIWCRRCRDQDYRLGTVCASRFCSLTNRNPWNVETSKTICVLQRYFNKMLCHCRKTQLLLFLL